MKTLYLILCISLFPVVYAHAQLVAPVSKDTIRQHKHPDSMYAKVIINVIVLPNSEPKYEVNKTICNDCDSSRIKYIQSEALFWAKQKKNLKTGKYAYGETGARYVFPFLFSLPKQDNGMHYQLLPIP